MKKKQVTPPTFEERLVAAQVQAQAATSVFDGVIADLENAAVQKKALVSDIDAEIQRLADLIDRLHGLAFEAETAAEDALVKANAIRALVGA